MTPISTETIEQIKSQVDMVAVITSHGVELKPQGSDWVGLCPFHSEATPSFHITPSTGLWHCFGCNQGGDVIDFVRQKTGQGFTEVLEQLQGAALSVPMAQSSKEVPKTDTAPGLRWLASERFQALGQEVVRYYQHTLENTPSALAYLQSRGLNHPELVATFRLGYANRSLHKLVPKEDEDRRTCLRDWGFLRPHQREHFIGCLTVPIFQTNGLLGEVYGRRTSPPRKDTAAHLYLPGSHHGVFNVACWQAGQPLILCESAIDAMSFWVQDFRQVTASFGASGFTEEMLVALQTKHIKEVWIAYDADEAGNTQAQVVAERLRAVGLSASRLLLPPGRDVNEVMTSSAEPRVALQQLIDTRQTYAPAVIPREANPAASSSFSTHPPTLDPSSNHQPHWDGQQLTALLGDRHYRLRGLELLKTLASLKVQIRVKWGTAVFLDTVELTSHRQRHQFCQLAAEELGLKPEVLKRDVGQWLLHVEQWLEQRLRAEEVQGTPAYVMSAEEQSEALSFLKAPDLLTQILADFDTIGLVGEETNKLIAYLAAVSRKLDTPLAVLVQSSSSAGKTTLMDGVLALVPPEDYEKWTSITAQSLYYVEESQLTHRLLAVAEEEGVEKATYPLKILQSEKELRIATTIKDPKSGEFKVQNKVAKGPTALMLTTTSAEVDEELVNRFLRLTVNEDRQQTQAIHQRQRQAYTAQGLKQRLLKDQVSLKHHNAQRLLQPFPVLNPYADQLTFFSDYLRSRRDHQKYLQLINTLAFLHQYQRPTVTVSVGSQQVVCIEVALEDIRQANRLMTEVLGRCLDELAPQTRRLLGLLWQMVKELAETRNCEPSEVQFTRRTVRDYTHWSDNQLKVHLKRLEDLEYLLPQQGGRGQIFIYELLWNGAGEEGQRFLPGLLDPDQLRPVA